MATVHTIYRPILIAVVLGQAIRTEWSGRAAYSLRMN
jgi:hypothetical protein